MKKIVSLLTIIGVLLGMSILVFAAETPSPKEEAVYGLLDVDGSVRSVFVVNSIEGGYILDYGDYSRVINLSDSLALIHNGDKITADTRGDKFFYQGTLNAKELPWNIAVKYALNGKETTGSELAGKNGEVDITLSITPNQSVNQVFFEHFVLQVTFTLDTKSCEKISSPGATIANAGMNKLITHTVMPGKSAEIKLEASVQDFHMDGIEFAATPFSMAIDPPDISGIKDDMNALTDAVKALNDGIKELEGGLAKASPGAKELATGSLEFKGGLSEINENSDQLLFASASIKAALTEISASVSESNGETSLGELIALPGGLRQLAAGLNEVVGGLAQLKEGYTAAYAALESAINEIPDTDIDPTALYRAVYSDAELTAALDSIVAYYAAAKRVKGTFTAVGIAFDSVEGSLGSVSDSVGLVSTQLSDIADGIEQSLDNPGGLSQLKELAAGLTELSDHYGQLHGGLVSYMGGVSGLAKGYKKIDAGVSDLSDGLGSLSSGAGELSDGAQQLNDALTHLPRLMETEIEKLLNQYDKSDFPPVSFVSDKNINVTAVQFVFKTAPIKVEAQTTPVQPEPVKLNFWQKLLKLFGLYR